MIVEFVLENLREKPIVIAHEGTLEYSSKVFEGTALVG